MAVSNQEIVNYLQTPGRSDAQIAADMDKYGVTAAQMAAAIGGNAGTIQGRYDTAKAISAFDSTNKGGDTAWADQMLKAGWSPEDVSRVTGVDLDNVNARYKTASELNRVNKDLTGLQSSYSGLQGQMSELQKAYDELNKKGSGSTAPTGGGIIGGGGAVDTGGTATTGVVYGPDGTMYSSAAAALAAGVKNYSSTKPAGVIAGANTLGSQFINAGNPNTGNVNSGGLIGNAQQQLFKNPVSAQLPGNVANPFMIKS